MESKVQKSFTRTNIKSILFAVMAKNYYASYLGKDAVCNFINSMVEKNQYCSDVMKKHFNKELVMIKENNEDFKNSTKY